MAGVEGCSVVAQHKKSRISGVIRYISSCTRDSFGIVPVAFRYDISKSHAAYGRVEGCCATQKSLISVVIRCISRCTRDSFGIIPAAFRYDICKSHAAYGRQAGTDDRLLVTWTRRAVFLAFWDSDPAAALFLPARSRGPGLGLAFLFLPRPCTAGGHADA